MDRERFLDSPPQRRPLHQRLKKRFGFLGFIGARGLGVLAVVAAFFACFAERPWGSKAFFLFQPAAPGDFNLIGLSFGYYRFFGHDWTGVDLAALGFPLWILLFLMAGAAASAATRR